MNFVSPREKKAGQGYGRRAGNYSMFPFLYGFAR